MTLRWGVVGVGRAGRARVEAIRADPRAVLVGGFRGRPVDAELVPFECLDELLASTDAVAICAPDTVHPALVHAALRADRHVVCEFPLASSADDAECLFELAASRGRVLHVEHIELLTPTAAWLRQRCAGRPLVGGALRFSAPPRTGVHSLAHGCTSSLHRLVDAVGLPDDVLVLHKSASHLRATLQYGPGSVELHLESGPTRSFYMQLRLEDGTVEQRDRAVLDGGAPVALPAGPGLFATDQLCATARILDGAPAYVGEARIADILGLACSLNAG